MEGPIWVKELGDMTPEMPVVHTSPKSDKGCFWDLIFVSKESNEYQS
jgi:hypothetical protein